MSVSAEFRFPKPFLWGVACSSAYHSACGWRTESRWKLDFDDIADSGMNALKISLNWSKIQPRKDFFDISEIDYTKDLIRGALERNIRPVVSICDGDLPGWFTDADGWKKDESSSFFLHFVEYTLTKLPFSDVQWVTFENIDAMLPGSGITAFFRPGDSPIHALQHIALAHHRAYQFIHGLSETTQIGIAVSSDEKYASALPRVFQNGKFSSGLQNRTFPEYKGNLDFLLTEGKTESIPRMAEFGFPMIFMSGIDDPEDRERPLFLARTLLSCWRNYCSGIPLLGFLYDSLNDIPEVDAKGLRKLSADSPKRIPRPSAQFYSEIIRKNALNVTDADQFASAFRKEIGL